MSIRFDHQQGLLVEGRLSLCADVLIQFGTYQFCKVWYLLYLLHGKKDWLCMGLYSEFSILLPSAPIHTLTERFLPIKVANGGAAITGAGSVGGTHQQMTRYTAIGGHSSKKDSLISGCLLVVYYISIIQIIQKKAGNS